MTLKRTPVFLAEDTVLVGPAHFLGLLGDPGVDGLHLALPFSPFCLVWVGSLGIEIDIVLDVLEHKQQRPGTHRSGILRKVILGLPPGGTHSQQVSREVSVIQGQYFLGRRIRLGTVKQARQRLEIAVKLFDSDEKLTYRNPIGLFQRVRDVVLERLAGVKTKHGLEVKFDTLLEG